MGTPHGGISEMDRKEGERMSDLLNPANIIVLGVIAIGMFFGLRRIAASTHGKSCCSDGASGKKAKRVVAVSYTHLTLPTKRIV